MNIEDKNLITQIAAKKLETTMIGCLARFENTFGYLWAHHKSHNSDLTDNEIYFDNLWQDVRNNILNHGNNQIRALTNELNKFLQDELQPKYHYKFYPRSNKEDAE